MKLNKKNIKFNFFSHTSKKILLVFTLIITFLSFINPTLTFGESALDRKHFFENSLYSRGNEYTTNISEKDAISIIQSIDADYDVIIVNNNYKVNNKYYYVLHSNLIEEDPIKINKNYSDIFEINKKTFFRIHTTYNGIGKYSGYRYCINKENGEIYLEYVENDQPSGVFIKYSDYIENMCEFIAILNTDNIQLNSHVDVTICKDTYRIHLFSIIFTDGLSFTETSGWYDFNTTTRSITDIIN